MNAYRAPPMDRPANDASADAMLPSIMAALTACYGSLSSPTFKCVYAAMSGPTHRNLVAALGQQDVELLETTDENDDVSTQLVVSWDNDQVGLGLSGVGPFAALIHGSEDEGFAWVTRADAAPTPLAGLVASLVEQAGFLLLDRSLLARTVKMNRFDGTGEATLYQALFTDSDRIP